MKRIVVTLVALAALAFASTASAGGAPAGNGASAVSGARCVQAGVGFLIENDLLVAAARRQIDYDTIDSDSGGSEGLINTDLPAGSYLSLGTVIRLHFTNPELFDWCS